MDEPQGFKARVSEALDLVERALSDVSKPVLLCSFGKDSLCVLALIEILGLDLEIAYFELDAIPATHKFARQQIARLDRTITILRPHSTFAAAGAGGVDLGYNFKLANGDTFSIVGATFIEDGSAPTCGLQRSLVKSGCHAPYEWDAVLTGRRSADVDPTLGSLWVESAMVTLEHGTKLTMPICHWSDEDIAHFLRITNKFAPDWDRYEVTQGKLTNKANSSSNPDIANVCIRCIVRRDSAITCPLLLPLADIQQPIARREEFLAGSVPPTVML